MANRDNETKEKKKIGDILKENLQKITIILVSFLYIIQGLFKITKKDASVIDILGNIGMSVAVGLIISSSMNSMGLRDGRYGDIFSASMALYGKSKVDATPYFDKIGAWCDYKNSKELEYTKKDIIQSAGLNWKAYKYGYYDIEENKQKLEKKQVEALVNAKYCKIYRLTPRELLSDLPKEHKSIFGKMYGKFGESEQAYKQRKIIVDLFAKLFIALVCGLYGLFPLWDGTNRQEIIAGILWNTLQITMWISFGTVKYSNAKSFMIDEYRQTHIIQKTEYLNEFIITMQKTPNIIENYDDSIEIDKYVEKFIHDKEELINGGSQS